ncbi:hypothetical protein PRIPAC_75451 [Pristionchus pacificus]|uniref:Acyltransferase n=1 Tax=Pristionchus pacificus TaxID=54126 RepID=A0A2A6CAL0_PRIPA|nr:hypothetical protein PRIPAC_75451 [Pristionchus pacificus]|eukprot:PDM75061.1 hypothetical protein PRIPAC_40442 [Pristionchus pacificus]
MSENSECFRMTNILGMKLAPLNTPLRRRLETSSVLFHLFANSVVNLISGLIFIWMLIFGLAPLVFLYCVWLWWDWESPYKGGYASRYFLNLQVHKLCASYFPLKFHTTSELPDDQNYLIGMHPHGVCGMSAYHFMSNGTGLWDRFPKINFHTCTLVGNFWVPLRREWLMLHGVINCSKESLRFVLGDSRKGQATLLVVGGAEEALDAHSGKHKLTLLKRKGFIKIALETGAHLVPCFAFGENDVYIQASNKEGTVVRWMQTMVKKWWGVSPILFFGRGIFNYTFGFMPFRTPLNTVLGTPIPVEKVQQPTQIQIDELHSLYIQRLTDLYEEHKEKYGIAADNHLIIR